MTTPNVIHFKVGEDYYNPINPSKTIYHCLYDDGEVVLFRTIRGGVIGSNSWYRGLSGERNFLDNLRPKPKIIEGWINVYKDDEGTLWTGIIHPTKDEAKQDAVITGRRDQVRACISIRFTEGDGL